MTNALMPICISFLVVGLFLYLVKGELENIQIMVSSEYLERYRAIVPLLLLLIIIIILLTLAILCTYSRVRLLFGISDTQSPNQRSGSQIFFSLIQLNISGRSISSNSLFTEPGVVTHSQDQEPPPEYSTVVFEPPKKIKLAKLIREEINEEDEEEELEPPAYDTITLTRTESCDSSSTPEPISRPPSIARLNTGVSISRDVSIQIDRSSRFSAGSSQFATTNL